jgi:hypothetical protein
MLGPFGKDEVGGSNPPSSSIESLEPQGVRGFLIFGYLLENRDFQQVFQQTKFRSLSISSLQ